ncbi:hypothetical protein B0H19DRAFT_1240576 [Mycena capillaripes]|nr:hypothetical protein B0H19DRAFT_1240576 [Mycena capillaripes]
MPGALSVKKRAGLGSIGHVVGSRASLAPRSVPCARYRWHYAQTLAQLAGPVHRERATQRSAAPTRVGAREYIPECHGGRIERGAVKLTRLTAVPCSSHTAGRGKAAKQSPQRPHRCPSGATEAPASRDHARHSDVIRATTPPDNSPRLSVPQGHAIRAARGGWCRQGHLGHRGDEHDLVAGVWRAGAQEKRGWDTG